MSRSYWKSQSLRSWVALGMTISVAPLAALAVIGYWLLNHGVIAPFDDVVERKDAEIFQSQELRLAIWDTLAPVDEFVEAGGAEHAQAYRLARKRIETGFAELAGALEGQQEALSLIERARTDWSEADRLATRLVSGTAGAGEARTEIFARYHAAVESASDRLGAFTAMVYREIKAEHAAALKNRERMIWISAIAGLVSLMFIVGGVLLVGRIMANSVDRLVEGALRVAEGDRRHRVNVEIPPELKRVAEEFNKMIEEIHESETALADLARRDGLTRLLNRRAFDEALEEMFARIRRYDQAATLLTLDIDHFKKINDAYGHGAGDEVLCAVAQTMAAAMRPFDHVYRCGGEEFAVLMPGVPMAEAREAAERLRAAIAAETVSVHDGGVDISVTASIGVAEASAAITPQELLAAADAALYHAKARGRNQVVAAGASGFYVQNEPISLEEARLARG